MSGRLSAAAGTLYDGTKSEVTYSGRWGVVPQFSMEPGVTLDWVRLPFGDFTARLLNSRFTITPSARMLISSLVQYNASANSLELQHPPALGIHRRQRAVRRLQRRAQCGRSRIPGAAESHVRDQSDAAGEVLSETIAA